MTRHDPRSNFARTAPGLRRGILIPLGFLLLAAPVLGQASKTTTFTSPGTKQVSLTVCNGVSCNTVTKSVVVLDPKPQIIQLNLPVTVGAGHALALQASANGRPPLTYKWTFSGLIPTVVNGNPSSWTPLLLGTYQAQLEVSNASGVATSAPVNINVVPWTFDDVPPGYWAWRFIENLGSRGISSGCGGNPPLYCPNAGVTRGEMALLLLRSKEGGSYVPPPCTAQLFNDMPCSNPLAPWVNELVARGVTAGCGGGNYCPSLVVTRNQMAVFLLVTLEGAGYSPDTTCTTAPFSDVPCSSPFAIWVRELVGRGVTAGCGAGKYCPADTVNEAQMSVFLSTAFNLPPSL